MSDEDGSCRVQAPLERRDGDPFEVLVHEVQDGFEVSDQGDTLDYLQLSGINTRKNRALERLTLEVSKAHAVSIDNGTIVARATGPNDIGDTILRVLASMNDISQFEISRRSMPPRTFDVLVEGELVGQGVPYESRVTHEGEIRRRAFRFGIDGQRQIVVEPMAARSTTRAVELAAVLIVSVEDVWRRNPNLAAIAVLDDKTSVWGERALPDLQGSGINTVLWSSRHEQLPSAISSPRRGRDQLD